MSRGSERSAMIGHGSPLLLRSPRPGTMVMPDLVRRYTVQEVLQFPDDGKRYELVRGDLLVSPPPALRHQIVVQGIFLALLEYLKPLGRQETVFCVGGDISWNDETLVLPDLFDAPPEELRSSWSTVKTLLLAVEVISRRCFRVFPISRAGDLLRGSRRLG